MYHKREYSEEFKRNMIERIQEARKNKMIHSLMSELKSEYSEYQIKTFRSWVWKVEKGKELVKKYNRVCEKCGADFQTENPQKKYCHETCRIIATAIKYQNRKKTKSEICSECVNYWACGKATDPLKVQARMKEYKFKYYDKADAPEVNGMCLRVYECEGFMGKNELTTKQLKMKRDAFIKGIPVFFEKEV